MGAVSPSCGRQGHVSAHGSPRVACAVALGQAAAFGKRFRLDPAEILPGPRQPLLGVRRPHRPEVGRGCAGGCGAALCERGAHRAASPGQGGRESIRSGVAAVLHRSQGGEGSRRCSGGAALPLHLEGDTATPSGFTRCVARSFAGALKGLSRMRGNSHVRFLGEGATARSLSYPTLLASLSRIRQEHSRHDGLTRRACAGVRPGLASGVPPRRKESPQGFRP